MRKRTWILGSVILILIALGIGSAFAALYFSRGAIRELIRQRTEAYLSARFQSQVTFLDFSIAFRRGVCVTVTDLTLRHQGRTDLPPLIEIREANFQTSLAGILRKQMRIDRVELAGLQIRMPPRAAGEEPFFSGADANLAKKYPLIIGDIVADYAVLEPLPKDPSKAPRPFFIHHVELHDFKFDRPARFEAELTNPVPRGEIACQGEFGPWIAEEPSATPVNAQFTFKNADLGTLKGLSGTLSSSGSFRGPLDELQVDGETDTPNFALRTSSGPVALHTVYSAVVDGTNGDVILKSVTANFLNTTLLVSGEVVDLTSRPGRTIELDAVAKQGRVEDLLRLAVRTQEPVMTGGARLRVKIDIPERNEDLLERMRLQGQFRVDDALFTNPEIQNRVNSLSHRAQGEPRLAAAESERSQLRGAFGMADGKVKFSQLNFGVQGASMTTAGTYSIDSGELNFRGKLQLDAALSRTTTGVKSVFLKAVDPFFRGKDGGAALPIKITGTKDAPKYGLDLFDRKAKEETAAAKAKLPSGSGPPKGTHAEAAR